MHRRDSRLAVALARWQHAAGQYWPYVCATPFLALDYRPRSILTGDRRMHWLDDLIGSASGGRRIAAFVDLPPRETLPATRNLNDRGWIVVPVIQRWVEEPAMLDCGVLAQQLVVNGEIARHPKPSRGVVFLLDGDRAGPDKSRVTAHTGRAFDNRYAYPPCRFPPPSFLLRDGVSEVCWLSREGIASDLEDYVAGLTGAGLEPKLLSVPDRQARSRKSEPRVAQTEERRALPAL